MRDGTFRNIFRFDERLIKIVFGKSDPSDGKLKIVDKQFEGFRLFHVKGRVAVEISMREVCSDDNLFLN